MTELTDNFSGDAWIAWAKRKAEEAAADPPESRQNGHTPAPDTADPEPPPGPLDPAEARRQARHAAFNAGAWV